MHTSTRARLDRIEKAMGPKGHSGIVVLFQDLDDPKAFSDATGVRHVKSDDGEMRDSEGEEVHAELMITVVYRNDYVRTA